MGTLFIGEGRNDEDVAGPPSSSGQVGGVDEGDVGFLEFGFHSCDGAIEVDGAGRHLGG